MVKRPKFWRRRYSFLWAERNTAVVEVSVGDINDNAPLFLSNPLILGVPTYVTHNDLVGVIQVTLIKFWKRIFFFYFNEVELTSVNIVRTSVNS